MKMEIQIKKAVKAGNSSAVILPRSWLNKEVRVELIKKTPEVMLLEIISIIKNYIEPNEIIGIYLTGSYARGEENKDSDIDILIITKETNREVINEGLYNLTIVSEGLLKQKLKEDLFPIGQMIRETIPLINSDYLSKIEIKVTKENTEWYLTTTRSKLAIIKKVIEALKNKNKECASDKIAYTLILRIITLNIIENLILGKAYSKKSIIKLIKRITKGKKAFERYLAVKNNLEDKEGISLREIEELYNYLTDYLSKIELLFNLKR